MQDLLRLHCLPAEHYFSSLSVRAQSSEMGDVHVHFIRPVAPTPRNPMNYKSQNFLINAAEKSVTWTTSATRFSTSYRWSQYVTPKSPKGGSKSKFVIFVNKNQFKSNKLCYKVSLCENFQQQSCSRTIPLSNGVLAVNVTLEPNISPQSDPTLFNKADVDVLVHQP